MSDDERMLKPTHPINEPCVPGCPYYREPPTDNPFEGLHYGDEPLPEPQMAVTADGDAAVARFSTHDCMFHDEGIPDAPCICRTGKPVEGSHEIVQGEVVAEKFSHPGLTHRDGSQCIFVDGSWFVPLDVGGEGYDCSNVDHREIAAPRRGDQVEAYLKAKRDRFDKTEAYGRGLWFVFDDMLDEYRLAADMGMSLAEILNYKGPR